MDNKETSEAQEYIDGANLGYFLNKYSPEIIELISGLNVQGKKFEGLIAGMDYQEKENEPTQLPGWLQKDRFKTHDKSMEPDKEIDKDYEPEKD